MENNEINVTVELEQERAMNGILKDTINQQGETIKHMKHIIITLICAFFITLCFGFGAFVWFESQFEYTSETQETEVYTEGDNANASYTGGDQYNDSSTHNEGVE